jgi:hypothetical protein
MNAEQEAEREVIILFAGQAAERRAVCGSEPGFRRRLTLGQRAAFHEAGHAVSAWMLGLCVIGVNVIADPNVLVGRSNSFSGGVTFTAHEERSLAPGCRTTTAERVPSDLQKAAALCALLSGRRGWRPALAVARGLRRASRDMLNSHWRLVQSLAVELERDKVLTRERILFFKARCLRAASPPGSAALAPSFPAATPDFPSASA